jgi:hypothetical protein
MLSLPMSEKQHEREQCHEKKVLADHKRLLLLLSNALHIEGEVM